MWERKRSQVKMYTSAGQNTKLSETLMQVQFNVSALWYADGKLALEVNLCPGHREGENTTGTLSRSSSQSKHKPNTFQGLNSQSNQHIIDMSWTDPRSDFQNKYTEEHGRLHRESNLAAVTKMNRAGLEKAEFLSLLLQHQVVWEPNKRTEPNK